MSARQDLAEFTRYLSFLNRTQPRYKRARIAEFTDQPTTILLRHDGVRVVSEYPLREAVERLLAETRP